MSNNHWAGHIKTALKIWAIALMLLCLPPAQAIPPFEQHAGHAGPMLHHHSSSTAHILVIDSNHPGLNLTDLRIDALREEVYAGWPDVEMHIEYMDARRIEQTPELLEKFSRTLAEKYEDMPLTVLVVFDDDALDFILETRRQYKLFANVPVVFSGVSSEQETSLKNEKNITGYFDGVDLAANIRLMESLFPKVRHALFISDSSHSGRIRKQALIEEQNNFPELGFRFLDEQDLDDKAKELHALDTTNAVFILSYSQTSASRTFLNKYPEGLTKAPTFVLEDGMLDFPGALGGLVISGRAQGTSAAERVLEIIKGGKPDSLPVKDIEPKAVFNYPQLVRQHIDVSALPYGVDLRKRPGALSQIDPEYFIMAVGALAFLLFVILIMAIANRRLKDAKLAVIRSEKTYREILDSTLDAILIFDMQRRIIDVNKRFFPLFGYQPGEEHQLDMYKLGVNKPPYDEERLMPIMQQVMKGEPQAFEWRAETKDGQFLWVEIALRIGNINGQKHFVAAVREIGSRKAAEDALRDSEFRHRIIVNRSPIGIMQFDQDMNITYCNEKLAESVHLPKETVMQMNLHDIKDQSLTPTFERTLDGFAGHYEGPFFLAMLQRQIWVSVRTEPLVDKDGTVLGGVTIMEDISGRKLAEDELRELNENLEQRVEKRTTELKQVMNQLSQSEKLASLGSLVAGVAHELNTPLGNALTVASTLRQRLKDFGQTIATGALKKSSLNDFLSNTDEATLLIERNAMRAAELISHFKQVAVDQTSVRRRKFDLAQLITEALSTVRPQYKHTTHNVESDIPPGISMDSFPGPLEQIIINFISNSLEHGFEGIENGAIRISASSSGENVTFIYADTGIGMPSGVASKIFDPFYTTKLGHGGSGLGLYIVYNLVTNLLGGKIDIETAPGQGTRFILQLPLTAPQKT